MSGGSYDYLCYKDPDQLMSCTDQLQSISDRLAGLGYAPDAAAEVQELLLTIRQYDNRISSMMNRLTDVMRSVEWWDSGDCGEDAVKKSLEKYRGNE